MYNARDALRLVVIGLTLTAGGRPVFGQPSGGSAMDHSAHDPVGQEGSATEQAGPTDGEPSGFGPAAGNARPTANLSKAAAGAYKGLFYNNDFSYLNNPAYDDWHLGENGKQLSWCCATFDLGGEYRFRYHSEHNLRAKPLSGADDDFMLHRTRLYCNARFGDWGRVYVEAIDAASDAEDLPPRPIEVNRFDALNLFGDAKLLSDCCLPGDLWVRGGRQELLYGAQRLVSPLDWGNTRRTFDGAKLFYSDEQWKIDAWWTRPVPAAQHTAGGDVDHNFDSPDLDQEFLGLWATYKPDANRTADFYFLRFADYRGTLVNANARPGDADFNAFGARLDGKHGHWLYEAEGAYQFGQFGPDSIQAGFFTLGVGRSLGDGCLKPKLWVYYDWASGDDDPTDGVHGTFDQYFPLAHKYLGYMDIVGRQNIQDVNVLATIQPHKDVEVQLWYHVFYLQSATDALYNAAGAPIYQDPTGSAGNEVGQELDLLVVWRIAPRLEAWFGYSHFWHGEFFDSPVIQTAGTPPGGIATNGSDGEDADFFYTQWTLRF